MKSIKSDYTDILQFVYYPYTTCILRVYYDLFFTLIFTHQGTIQTKRNPRKHNDMLPLYRTMKYKSPIWGYFHVQKE